MAEYRYFTVDLLTGNPVMELPQYGVSMDKQMSAAGSYTGFFRLGTGIYNDDLLLAGCVPGQHAIMVQRDGVNIWGGPIWSRTYSAESNTIQINANTFESVFEHIIMSFDVIYQDVDTGTLITSWLNALMTQDSGANNVQLTPNFVTPGVTVPHKTILIPAYEYHLASDFMQEYFGDSDYAYTINLGTGDNPVREMVIQYPTTPSHFSAAFDYPGSISKYWLNENGTRIGIKNVVLGAGSGNQLMKSIATNTAAGMPAWGAVESHPNIGTQSDLDAKAAAMARLRKPPVYELTVELSGDNHGFTGWNDLISVYDFYIQDARFPGGQHFAYVLTGWSLVPGSKSSVETVNLTVQDFS